MRQEPDVVGRIAVWEVSPNVIAVNLTSAVRKGGPGRNLANRLEMPIWSQFHDRCPQAARHERPRAFEPVLKTCTQHAACTGHTVARS